MKKFTAAVLIVTMVLAGTLSASAAEYGYTVTQPADGIVIDGSITAAEWGDPICTFTPQECLDNRHIGWGYKNYSSIPAEQKLEIWLTNDGDNVYLACRLNDAIEDMSCETGATLAVHPHLCFTLSPYVEETVVPHAVFQNQDVERYTGYAIGFVGGESTVQLKSNGIGTGNHKPIEYEVVYDEASSAYIYEAKVALSNTDIDLGANPVIVMSFDVCDGINGGKSGNRYLIARGADMVMDAVHGAYVYAHGKSNPPVFTLFGSDKLSGQEFIPDEGGAPSDEAQTPSDSEIHTVIDGEQKADKLSTPALIAGAGALVLAAGAVTAVVVSAKRRRG